MDTFEIGKFPDNLRLADPAGATVLTAGAEATDREVAEAEAEAECLAEDLPLVAAETPKEEEMKEVAEPCVGPPPKPAELGCVPTLPYPNLISSKKR